MNGLSPDTPLPGHGPRRDTSPPSGGPCPRADDFAVVISRPTPTSVMLRVSGDIDAWSWERLAPALRFELVHPYLLRVVIDMGEVGFLSVEAVRLLGELWQEPPARGVALRLVATHTAVRRAIELVAPFHRLTRRDDLATALLEPLPEPPDPEAVDHG